jgi:hypothetical protein
VTIRTVVAVVIWLAAATVVALVTGRCLSLMDDPDE